MEGLVKAMNKWKSQLEQFDLMLQELHRRRQEQDGGLRFGRSVIIVSDIAEQYYCEKKVEMQYLHGEVETEEKTIGTQAHEKLEEDAVKIERTEMWKEIYGKKPVFAVEMFILAKYNDAILGGKPDAVLFQSGLPLILFEFKFSKSRIAYSTHHIQAQTYGVVLENMGFDTRHLFYAIVTADPKTRGNKKFRKEAVDAVIQNGPKEAILQMKNATIHFHKFNRSAVENNLSWAIDYWKQNREATPTNNTNKCTRCEYQTQCKH
jgi:CRISPR/Cas system-associated exonuclease Cas4 (RecB family)